LANAYVVGSFNRRVLNNAKRQAYSTDERFQVFDGVTLFGIDELIRRTRERRETTPEAAEANDG